MNNTIKITYLEKNAGNPLSSPQQFGREAAKRARAFHGSFPEYRETPLVNLRELAAFLGVASIHVKDESFRFGLNAFKVLGGSYAIGNYVAKRLDMDISGISYNKLVSREIKEKLGTLTFITATDGNHGRGIAWTAQRLGQNCVVYMPKGSAPERLENIRKLGAKASITDLNYDGAVHKAKKDADENGWIFVQDTAWPGYEEIPGWIMEGYTTMALEALEQMGEEMPTHIFLQAGVGAMAGAVTGFFADVCGKGNRPIITIVEPEKADCIYQTALANDGKLHFVTGGMDTIMAGLACGEPCTLGWEMLRDYADYFVSIPDYVAAEGMRILGSPLEGDPGIVSGESGAAGLGFAAEILRKDSLKELRDMLRLNGDSRILCFSTEGDTDRENYRKILWDDWYSGY